MVDPVTVAALASAASTIGQNAANVYGQSKLNKKTMRWNERMYAKQRADSLADFNMQNEYNSPEGQMRRLQEAGLNPNLVYGSGVNQDAASIKSSDTKSWNPQVPDIDLSGIHTAAMGYIDTRVKEAQIDNLRTANTVAVQDAALRAAQVSQTVQNTRQSEFTLKQAQALSTVSIETAKAQLEKLKTETHVTIQSNERAAVQNLQSLKESAERILSIRAGRAKTDTEKREIEARIEIIRKDNYLKQLDINLRNKNVFPHDPLWWRMLGQILDGTSSDELKKILP